MERAPSGGGMGGFPRNHSERGNSGTFRAIPSRTPPSSPTVRIEDIAIPEKTHE